MYRECCIPGCNSNSKRNDVMLHKMPAASEKVMLWHRTLTSVPFIMFEGLTWGEISKFYVCHKHFEAKYITRKMRLKPTARPTLFTLEEMASGKPAKNSSADTGSTEVDCMGISEHSYVRKLHYDHTYAMSAPTNDLVAAGPSHMKSDTDLPPANEENKLDSSLYEDGDAIPTDTCDNDNLPPSPREEFTTNIVSEIGEQIELENFKIDKIFSWQKSELIEADDSEDPKPAAVPEKPNLTLSLFCEAEPPPLQPAPIESDLPPANEENKLDSSLYEDGDAIPTDTCDNDNLPPSPREEFTTNIVSEIGEHIELENFKIDKIFSWQKSELIEADGSEDTKPAAVPEQPKIPEDLTLSLFCEAEPPPLQPAPIESVAVVPEDVEYRCKDCAAVIDGFSWWCVPCACGALCGACALRPPHDAHHVLRAPPAATHNQTQAVLAVIREQLLQENLLSLYGTDDDGVKVEVKQEPEERPPSPPLPAATPDPLAMEPHTDPLTEECYTYPFTEESYTDPFDLESQPDTLNKELITGAFTVESYPEDPDPINVEPHLQARTDESLDEEAINHHPFKRPRLMDSQTLKTNTITSKDPSGSQTLVQVTPGDLKRLQSFLQAATNDPRISQDMLNAITRDLEGLETILQFIPTDPSESQTALQENPSHPTGAETVLQVDASDLNGSDAVLQIDPSDLKRLQDLLNSDSTGSETVHVDASDLNGSETVLQIDPSDLKRLQDLLNSDSTGSETVHVDASDLNGSETVLQIDPSDLKRLQDLLNSDSTGSETVHVDASDLNGSETVLQIDPSDLKRLQDLLNSDSTGSETVLHVEASDLNGSETVLQVDPSNLSGLEIILQDDTSDQLESQTVLQLQLDLDDLNGMQDFLSAYSNDPTLSQTVLQIDRNDLRRLQDVLQGTNSTETDQQVDPTNLNELQTSLQKDPTDHLGSQTVLQLPSDLKGSQTAMQIDPSGLRRLPDVLLTTDSSVRTVSQSLQKVTPSNRTGSQSLTKATLSSRTVSQYLPKTTLSDSTGSKSLLKVTSSDPTGSQSLLTVSPSDRTGSQQSLLQATPTDSIGSQSLLKITPSDRTGSQSLQKVTPSDRTGSRALPNIIARNRGASQSLCKVIPSSLTKSQAPDKIQPGQIMMSRPPQKVKHSDLSGSKTQQKSQPRIIRKSQTALKLKKVQNIGKGAPALRLRQNDPEGSRIEIPQNISLGKSVPLKVTSEPEPTKTVVINLDDELDECDVEFLEEEILDSDSEGGLDKEIEHTDEDTVRNIESEVVENIGDKRKQENYREPKENRDKDEYSDTNSSGEVIQVDENTRNEADSVRDFDDSDVDDSDLDKDYRVEADTIEDDSMDETDVEDIAGRGVGRSTRNATKNSEKCSSKAALVKDYRVEEENIPEDSMDDTDLEDVAGSSIGKRTRHEEKTREKSPSEAILRMLTSKEDPLAVPEQVKPETPEHLVPTFSQLPAPKEVPIEPYVPEDGDYLCEDCAADINGVSWWCAHCGRGARCGACAVRAPHDEHYTLRAPQGATYSQTQRVLAAIRQQLQNENLLPLYMDEFGIKLEVKLELEEPPSPPSDPAMEPTLDPKLEPVEPALDPKLEPVLDAMLETALDTGPDPVLDLTLDPAPVPAFDPLLDTTLDPAMESDPLTTQANDAGKEVAETKEDKALKQYLAKRQRYMENIKPYHNKNTNRYGPRSPNSLETMPNKETTALKDNPRVLYLYSSNHLRGSQALQAPSKPGGSQTRQSPRNLRRSQTQQTPSNIKSSQTLQTPSNLRGSQTALKVVPSDLIRPQTAKTSPASSQNVSKPNNLKIKRTLLKVPISELAKSKTVHLSDSGLKSIRKVKPSELLKLKKVQNVLKNTTVLTQQNDSEELKLHNVLKGFSTPLKVTSEPPRSIH